MSALRGCAFEGATVGRVPAAADVAVRADGRDVRDEQDRERARVVAARFEAAPVAGGCVGETVDRCEKTIAAGHSRNAMTRWGRRNAS